MWKSLSIREYIRTFVNEFGLLEVKSCLSTDFEIAKVIEYFSKSREFIQFSNVRNYPDFKIIHYLPFIIFGLSIFIKFNDAFRSVEFSLINELWGVSDSNTIPSIPYFKFAKDGIRPFAPIITPFDKTSHKSSFKLLSKYSSDVAVM